MFKLLFQLLIAICLSGVAADSFAQQSVHSAGGEALGSGGTVSFSVAQPFYREVGGAGGFVSEGVQKAFEIYKLGIIGDTRQMVCEVFPNPFFGKLTLLSEESAIDLHYTVFDALGSEILKGFLTGNSGSIDLSEHSAGTYFLNVYKNKDTILEQFKIIKL